MAALITTREQYESMTSAELQAMLTTYGITNVNVLGVHEDFRCRYVQFNVRLELRVEMTVGEFAGAEITNGLERLEQIVQLGLFITTMFETGDKTIFYTDVEAIMSSHYGRERKGKLFAFALACAILKANGYKLIPND